MNMHEHAPGDIALLSGSANLSLGRLIADELGLSLCPAEVSRFPDSELHIQIKESVRAKDVYVVQGTGPPVDPNLVELIFLADACRRAGASRVTAVVPYFGYARQDRRARGREALAARVVCDLLAAVRVERMIALDLHTAAIEGFASFPVEHLSAVPNLAEFLAEIVGPDDVIVAPDLGAVKLAERYSKILGLPVAFVHKTRLGPEEVKATALVGDVRGRRPIIVDDMITTGATVEAAVRAVTQAGARAGPIVVASHGLFVGSCRRRLAAASVGRVVASDSLPVEDDLGMARDVVSVARLFADGVRRLHRGESMARLVGSVD